MVEQLIVNQLVIGSNPILGAIVPGVQQVVHVLSLGSTRCSNPAGTARAGMSAICSRSILLTRGWHELRSRAIMSVA
jgi:hypothetical protein